jgi:transcriptional regulator GlxA family with amidase domain
MLDGKKATIYWQLADQFRERYPRVVLQPERLITCEDNIYCSAGIASACELCTFLIEKIWGIDIAQKVAHNFLMDVQQVQQDFRLSFDTQKEHSDSSILSAQQWMETNFSTEFLLEEIADRVGLGLRSFMRRFKKATGDTPLQYLQRIRIGVAKELLTTSVLSVDEVSYRTGYTDVSFFCRLFKRHTGVTPGGFRRTPGVTNDDKESD